MENTKLNPFIKVLKLPEIIDHLYRYYLTLKRVLESEQIKDEATKELIKEDIEFLEIEISSLELFYELMANIYRIK